MFSFSNSITLLEDPGPYALAPVSGLSTDGNLIGT